MRQLRAFPPALLAASTLLLTACDRFVSPAAAPPSSPAPGSSSVSTTSPSSAPASPSSSPVAAAPGTPGVAEATAGGVLTVNPKPAPLVPAWARHQLYELSFVLPVGYRQSGPRYMDEADADGYTGYVLNVGHIIHAADDCLIRMAVLSSATDRRATAPASGLPGQVSVSVLDLPGADGAWLVVATAPDWEKEFPGPYRTYTATFNTATRSYEVWLAVPRTAEGAEVAREAIASRHLTTG